MQNKYPSTWKRDFFDTPFSNNGELTKIASEWSVQLTGVTNQQIKTGIDKLSNRIEKVWPPNAMEFRDLCIGSEFESCLDAILCRLQSGDSHEWQNQLAFNVFLSASSDFKNAPMTKVPEMVKRRLNMIDQSSMHPLPNYTTKAIEKPVKYSANDKERRIFQSHMHSAIFKVQPELFEKTEEQKKQKYVERDVNSDLPPVMQKIFSPQGTNELIKKFKASGYIMPEKPAKGNFKEFSASEWGIRFRNYKNKAIEAITNFLREEGILV